MVERVERKGIIIPCLLFGTIAVSMLFKELPLLQNHPHFYVYLFGRVGIIFGFLVCSVMSILQIEFMYNYFPLFFYFLALAYEAHGQFFQPNYWLAYIESTTIFPFIFTLDKRLLAGLMFSGLALFNVVFFVTSHEYINANLFNKALSTDIFIGTIISTIIAYVTAETFIKEKMQKNQIYQRFIDLGKNISSIAHDIKGMISGPCTYSDMLHEKMSSGTLSSDDMQLVEFLKEDVTSVRDFVMEINQLVSTHVTDQESLVKVTDIVKSISRVFKSKIKKIKIEVVGDMMLVTKVDYLNRILINSIVNSCEAIHKSHKTDGKIVIYCEKNFLGISDNSGAKLGKDILKKLNNPYVTFTSKSQGSGLGVLLIRDYINAIGGKFKYLNHVDGVSLKVTFPTKIVVTNEKPKGQVAHELPEC